MGLGTRLLQTSFLGCSLLLELIYNIDRQEMALGTKLHKSYDIHPLFLNAPQISDYHFLPDTAAMAEKVKVCLQESEELPRDFTALFDFSLYQMDTRVLPDALK